MKMRKILLTIIITLLSFIGNNCFAQTFGGGNGSLGNPYQISTKGHLDSLAIYVNRTNSPLTFVGKYFIMMNDIDVSGTFTPIGNSTRSFRGNFNGDNYQIRMAKMTTLNDNRSGLFGQTRKATIQNISMVLDSISITGARDDNYSGLLIAYADSTTINNCNIGDSTRIYFSDLKKRNIVGGMVGYANESEINFSYSLCSLTIYTQGDQNNNSIGGLIGKAVNCTINNCYTRNDIFTDVQNNNSYVGGLVGTTQNSDFSNSYSAPNSFNSGFEFTGVIVSDTSSSDSNTFHNCYYLIDTAVHAVSDVGTGLTIDQMQDDSFIDSLNKGQNPPVWDSYGGLPAIFPPIIWPGGGSGTESDPFRIRYVIDLINLSEITKSRNFRNYFLRLENDINFNNGTTDSSSYFSPIGNYSNGMPFSGNFNGNMYAIANYRFNDSDSNNVGIFGYIKNAKIKQLGISNIYINANDNVGGLIAISDADNRIDSCFVYGFIKGKNNVGGLIGYGITGGAKIYRSFTNVSIDAQINVGGIAGNYKGTITDSYSNSEIYSSTLDNNYVGGIIGLSDNYASINFVYSTSKIIRKGSNINFGKITGNTISLGVNCYSRDSVFVNYSNANLAGYTAYSNEILRSSSFVTTLGSTYWKEDYISDRINNGYPILKYQLSPTTLNTTGNWQTASNWSNGIPEASQVVIIPNGNKLKIDINSSPVAAYIKVETGGELLNNTNLNLYGEHQSELYLGKWNLIGLSTYNKMLSCLYNYTDDFCFKASVKEFDPIINNWSVIPVLDNNKQYNFGQGFLVMPIYSLNSQLLLTSKIISKGVLYNNSNLAYSYTNTATGRFVSLANNYPISLNASEFINNNIAGIQNGIQGRLVYVYDANWGTWNTNYQNPSILIKPSKGFFVVAANTTGTLSFAKSQFNNTSGAKNVIKNDLIYVKAFANNQERESFLEFNDDADNAFDFNDGLMLFGNNYNSVEPFFKIPTPEINDSTTQLIKDAFSSLPYTTELDLKSQKNNDISLNFSNIPSNIHIYLLDSLLNKAQYLNEEPNYELQVNAGDNAKRLYVFFSYYKEDINEFFKPEMPQEIRIWNYNNVMNIEGKDLIRYEIYDVIGKKLLEEEVFNDDFQTHLSLNNGIYIVRAYSKTSSKTEKLSVNN